MRNRIIVALALVLVAAIGFASVREVVLPGHTFVVDSVNRVLYGWGAKPTTPTLPDGTPVGIGTPFFDTSTLMLYYWSGSEWRTAMSNEVDCSDFLGWGGPMCEAVPAFESTQRTVPVGPWDASLSAPSFRNDTLKLTAPATPTDYPSLNGSSLRIDVPDITPTGSGFLSVTGYDIVVKSSSANKQTIWGLGANVQTGTNSSSHSFSVGGYFQATHSGVTKGVTGLVGAVELTAGSSVENAIGTTGFVITGGATTAATSYVAAGDFRISGALADSSKLYKLYTGGYGRNYFMQPADATGDADYSIEGVNGKGILASGRSGQLQLAKASGGSKPACAAGTRGSIWYEPGGAGVADTWEKCHKNAGDAYAWVTF